MPCTWPECSYDPKELTPSERCHKEKEDESERDLITKHLCKHLQKMEELNKIGSIPNELQRWWDRHKIKDRERLEAAMNKRKKKKDKKQALKKLSKYERRLLGL